MSRRNEGTVEIVVDGVTHSGRWKIDKGMVWVSTLHGHKATQLGGMANTPETLARQLLSELVRVTKQPS